MRSQRRLVSPNNIVIESPFIMTVKTDNAGTSNTNQYTIPTFGTGYNYNVLTSDGQNILGVTGNLTITFPTIGSYDIEITGVFPNIFNNNVGDKLKITQLKQWGNNPFLSFSAAFYGCSNMIVTATDSPNLTNCNSLVFMFRGCTNYTGGNLTGWDVSNITTFEGVFLFCPNFDANVSNWDVTGVSSTNDFLNFFRGTKFSGDISNWNVSNVFKIELFAHNDTFFVSNISNWNVSNVTRAFDAFTGLTVSYPHLDSIYNNWSQLTLKPNVTIHFGSAKYTSAGQAGRDILTSSPNNWIITDGGFN